MAAFTAQLLFTSLALTLSLPFVTAQEEHMVTWASVSFIYHGEKTPSLHTSPYNLTPLGATQLYSQGQHLRERYINGTTGSVINGMTASVLDNSQIYMLGMDDNFVSASAMAFMQGLYPPFPELGEDAVNAVDGKAIQYPSPALNGYQYPALSLVSELDFNYLWVAGNIGCNLYSIAQVESLTSAAYANEIQATNAFYESLNSSVFWNISPQFLNYMNAVDLYEYALYEYNHNTTLYNSTIFTAKDLSQLEILASQQQWEWNTPTSSNTIGAIAGRTLASKVLQMFDHNIASDGVADKMTLLFGSYEPFLSFFALSDLATGPSASRFNSLPAHGSVMTFELFSYAVESANKNLTTPFPNTDDLWVQFLYRNGTDDSQAIISYPLFGRGNSEVAMKWKDFASGMGAFALNDIVDWCTSCKSITLFCEAMEDNTISQNCSSSSGASSSANKGGISGPIAGVIGATVTIASFILVAAILMLMGFRIDYHDRKASAAGAGGDIGVLKRSGSGGFKGAEKLASDIDLRLKGGAGASVVRHERVGSWELHESPTSPGGHSSLDKEIESGRVVSTADYSRHSEDIGHENPFGDPVKPLDQV